MMPILTFPSQLYVARHPAQRDLRKRDGWSEMLYVEKDNQKDCAMTLTLELPDNKEAALKAKAQAQGVSAEQYVQRMVDQDLERPAEVAAATPRRHISEVVREIWSDVPPESRADMPADGASEHDHYICGLPKRNA
jgi:hypothetical protein